MTSRPWMPLYVGDFIADTMHLGATETGIYFRLILHCWQHGHIPRDPRKLALISHCDTRLWHQYEEAVLQFFDVVDASTMQHRRVTTELGRCEEISNKRKASALQKHKKETANAEQMQTHLHSQKVSKIPEPRGSGGDSANSNGPTQADLERELFSRGRQVCGKSSGGLIASLLKAKQHDVALARSVVELAATKHDPREFVAAATRTEANGYRNGRDPAHDIMAAARQNLERLRAAEAAENEMLAELRDGARNPAVRMLPGRGGE